MVDGDDDTPVMYNSVHADALGVDTCGLVFMIELDLTTTALKSWRVLIRRAENQITLPSAV